MRLSDIMSSVDLTLFPKIALLLFLAAFAGLMIRTFIRYAGSRDTVAASMPLQDDIVTGSTKA